MTLPIKSHLLFVEDEAPVRELIGLYLTRNGFEVTTAASLSQGRQLVEELSFELAILDVNLGGESGLDLVEVIKRKSPTIRVIIYTGLDVDERTIQKTVGGRVDAFIRKTDALPSLLAAVRRLLSHS